MKTFKKERPQSVGRDILKHMIYGWSSFKKRRFCQMTGIDLETVDPLTLAVKPKSGNLYIFLDGEYKIMGIMEGGTYNDKYKEDFEVYRNARNDGERKLYQHVTKNWKHLYQKAKYLLEIPSDQRNYKPNNKYGVYDYKNKYSPCRLQYRLQQYKRQKADSINENDLIQIAKQIALNAIAYMDNPRFNKELDDKYNGWRNIPSIVEYLLRKIGDIKSKKAQYEDSINYCKRQQADNMGTMLKVIHDSYMDEKIEIKDNIEKYKWIMYWNNN